MITNTRANVNVRDKYKYNNARSEFLPRKPLRFLFHVTRLNVQRILSPHSQIISDGSPAKCLRPPLIARCNRESKLRMWQRPPGPTQNHQIRVQKEGRGSRTLVLGQRTSTNPGHTNSRYRQGIPDFTPRNLNWLQVRNTVWVRIQEDGKWCRGTIVSSRSTTDKVREGAMVSIYPERGVSAR